MTAMMMLDDVSPLERIKLSGQLAAQIAAAATATGMERVRVAGTIAGILAKLGAAQAAPERTKLTTQKLHAVIQAGVGVKSSKYSPSQRIDRTSYDVHTQIKGMYGVMSSQYIEAIAAALSAAGIEFDDSDIARGFVKVPVWQWQVSAPAPTAEPAPERLKNFGWDAVKLADYSLEQLAELRRQVEVEHANPFDEQSRYTENGRPTLHLYDAKGRKKLDALAWAVTYKLQERQKAGADQFHASLKERLLESSGDAADEYAAKTVGFESFHLYAESRKDKLPLAGFQIARARYKIVEHLDAKGRSNKNYLESLQLHGANGEGPAALSQLRNERVVVFNSRAKSEPFSLADGMTLHDFVQGHGSVAIAAPPSDPIGSLAGAFNAAAAEREPVGVAADPEAPTFEIIEHTTGRGKVIRGIVRTDLSYAEAKAIDEYTFKKDGGYFIREKHLESMGLPPAPPAPTEPVDPIRQAELDAEREQQRLQAEADRLANEQARQRQKLEQQVSKLRSVAASTLEKAEQELGRDRLANTSRRAALAASGIAAAERSRALALTMNNLADAIERGQAQHLAGISSRADVETLTNSLANARANYERAKGMSYGDQQKRKHDPITAEEARYAEMPRPRWDNAGASRAKVLDLIKGKRGAPALAKKIMYATFIEPEDVKALRAMVGQKEADAELGWYNVETLTKVERLKRAGITNNQELRDALVEFLEFRTGARAEDPIAKAERAIIGQKVGIDFFPTPKALAARMADLAGVSEGDRVLEPSAGNGNLADAAKVAGGQVDVIEISSQLRDILTAKGYEVVAHDFDAFTPSEPYDAVIMNPPFSNRRDAEHIMRAFNMLKAGGRLAAIAGEGVFFGTDAKAVAFRKWLDDHGADIEPLGAGTFKDTNLLATTGANARLVVMQK